MKTLLPPLFLLLLAFAACKKNKSALPEPTPPAGIGNGNTTPPETSGRVTITGIAPASGLPNTVITITGSNFGTSANDLLVFFNGVKAIIETVTSTEIKVLVPVTTSGYISVVKNNQSVTGPVFNYIFPELNAAYVSGDVTLHNQAEVDLFVDLNKGKQLQITGNLYVGAANLVSTQTNDITSIAGLELITSVSGQIFLYKINLPQAPFLNSVTSAGSINIYSSGFTSLSFNQLRAFSGSLTLNGLSQLNRIDIKISPNVGNISISSCPLLADMSFLNSVSFANQVSLSGIGATSIIMDKLTTVGSALSLSGKNLTSVSFRSLTTIGSSAPAGSLTVTASPLLASLNFNALTTMGGKLTLRGINITDMSGFGSLRSLGSILIEGNLALTDLHGLEHLTSLISAAIVTGTLAGSSPISRVNGIYISNNAKLTSLNGLQNVTNIPIAYISDNGALNDLCPFKASIIALSKLSAYSFIYRNQLDQYRTTSIAALTLTKNGRYATTQNAVDEVTLCK
ncbi:hypothetical protein DU508_16850 [Pedobacter chinensis]|uniref:IPT/TIG domain-containing protein n=1 Tax=Pedobacter chinensis TaxID=2282421 RepID=A0A369PWZ9_9SPHI|nr:IPT/TIG domain-containing protein [Pedobacter chinensis]RDC55246.1 hypothetical protein DU508_16850 [Pedobacter chinensis]